VDFGFGEDGDRLRTEVRSFLEETITPDFEERLYRSGVAHDRAFTDALGERGWLAPSWPPEQGGHGMHPLDALILQEEMQRADAPIYGAATNNMICHTLARMGSQELVDEVVPPALRGETLLVLGFSEPEAGSDVANAQCRAVRDGNDWVINGQKMFTTNGHIGDYVFLLTRTNTDVAKHKGLTTFLVPMDTPGIEVQAVYTLSGERTNITYYTDVRVDDRWRVGEVDQGWAVLTSALQDEHSSGYTGHTERLLHHAEQWAMTTLNDAGRPRIDDPDVRACLGRVAAEVEAALLLQRRAAWMAEEGIVPEAEGPMAKLYSSEMLERAAEAISELIGPDALRSYFEPTAPQGGRIEHILRFSLGTTIYAGTSEVQRNIIAQRGLGLPR
jgi:alkylation response protein AidB-like acyl-CoA dehydrogenase